MITERIYQELCFSFDINFRILSNYILVYLSSGRKLYLTFHFMYFIFWPFLYNLRPFIIIKRLKTNLSNSKNLVEVSLPPLLIPVTHFSGSPPNTMNGRRQEILSHCTYFLPHVLLHLPNCPQKDGKSKFQSQLWSTLV